MWNIAQLTFFYSNEWIATIPERVWGTGSIILFNS